tara:strand:- start:21 stop:344 length:324 start_codon:yes stop_codon:yes gene_type:complete
MITQTDNWIYVLEENEIEVEDIKRFDHEKKTFCIYRLSDGYFATDGVCTHEEIHLEDGLVFDDQVECPMHQGVFNIKTGKALAPPVCEDLKTYPVKVEDGKVYILIK